MAVESFGQDTTVSVGTALTAPGSANTKGDYQTLIASTAFDATSLLVMPLVGTADADILFDLAVGAAASESDIVSNILHSRVGGTRLITGCYLFPIAIASGSRISARYQANDGSGAAVLRLSCHLMAVDNVNFHECTSVVTYGATTADSGGTEIDPGATAHTKGAYIPITASTTADIKWIALNIGMKGNTIRQDAGWLIDIATGAESSESDVVSNIQVYQQSTGDIITPHYIGPFPVEIASGTRLTVRAQCGTNDATDRLIDVTLLGFNGTAVGGGGAHFSSAFMG